jgi:ADP-ribose pyrophosphatase YjhB (NUDIX family)
VITARRQAELDALAGELRALGRTVTVIALDLGAPGGAAELHRRTESAGIAVDLLINNAGFGTHQWFLEIPWEQETGGPVETHLDAQRLKLAFDHAEQLGMAVKRIRGKLAYAPIGFQLLPEQFTLRDLQLVHEAVLDRALNKDSFRRKMLSSGQLEATGEYQSDVDHRPAELYRFARRSAV